MKRILIPFTLLLAAISTQADDVVNILSNNITGNVQLDVVGETEAQAFMTGPDFMCLDFVTVRLRGNVPSSSARVEVWRGDGNSPEEKLTEIGVINGFNQAEANFRGDSTERPVLEPNTRYWVVVVCLAGNFSWRLTSDATTTGGSSGTMVSRRGSSTDSGANWTPSAPGNFAVIRIEASLFAPATVTSELDDGSSGTLRQVMANAADCTHITFAPNLSGKSIVLNGTQLDIDKSLIIDGSSLDEMVTIDGNNSSRIFEAAGSDDTVVLRSIALENGRIITGVGAAIDSVATLFLEDCRVMRNTVAGSSNGVISSSSNRLVASRVTVSDNVVNIGSSYVFRLADGEARIEDSTFSGNTGNAPAVAAIWVEASSFDAQVTIFNSSISGNTSQQAWAGLFVLASDSNTAILQLFHTTVTNNSTSGSGSGSGIALLEQAGGSAFVELYGSIVSGNTAAGQPADIDGNVSSGSFSNLIGVGGGLTNGVNANIVGMTNPLLSPLQDNGGPTLTHLPLRGSPALDSANGFGGAPDQRGVARPIGSDFDIGSVEAPDYATIDAAAAAANRAALSASLSNQLRKLKKKFKNARKKKQVAKVKKLKKQIKKVQRQIRAL